jgi:hypothetical protein
MLIDILLIPWVIVYLIQSYLGFGTAYRQTKRHGDNGVSLFGWLIVYELAAIVPYLGYYCWKKSKEDVPPNAWDDVMVLQTPPPASDNADNMNNNNTANNSNDNNSNNNYEPKHWG